MSNLVLYRKYRPQGFDSLIGQDHIKNTLENAISKGKEAHAYLFTGPRGTGKTSTAKIFAKALNCLAPNGHNPCGECTCCLDTNTDIIEMDAASNNGVDDIRDLREKVNYMPAYGRKKIYIIDEVHMLSSSAFNALLKTLEEPPPHIVFILATTEPHKIPTTIVSRCQRYDFRRIPQDEIVQRMKVIVEAEKVEVEDAALRLISQIAAGGMRDALSLLDQAISSVQGVVTLQDVIEITGAVDTRKIGTLIQYITQSNVEGALEHFNSCFERGQEPSFFLEEMLIYLRDILVLRKLGERASLKKGHNDPNFQEIANSVNLECIYDYMDALNSAMMKMKYHNDIQLMMEMTIVQMINNDNSNLQHQIDELRKMIIGDGSPSIPPTTENQSNEITLDNVRDLVTEASHIKEPKDPIGEETVKIQDDIHQVQNEADYIYPEQPLPEFLETFEESTRENTDGVPVEQVNSSTERDKTNNDNTLSQENLEENNKDEQPNFGDINVENIYLSEKEEEILKALEECKNPNRLALESKLDEIEIALKKTSVSTNSLFREFTIRAASETHVLVVHPEAAKVKLLEKDKNMTNVQNVIATVHEPLRLLVCSAKEWSRIKKVFITKSKTN